MPVTARVTSHNIVGPFLPWRPGFFLPQNFRATIYDDEVPYDIEMDVTVSLKSGPQVTSVRLTQREGGEPITPRAFRQARLGLYVETAATMCAYTAKDLGNGTIAYSPRLSMEPIPVQTVEGRRSGPLSTEFLRRVATAYRSEMESPEGGKKSPREAVRRAIGSGSPATASRWIAAARAAGLLDPTTDD